MKINERGFWENKTAEGHIHDEGLAKALVKFFKKENTSVIDIGCGTGYYTEYLWYRGINCVGYDGNPNTYQLTMGFCKEVDFTVAQNLGEFGWALSLEVGEHIPQEYEEVFLQNLDRHNRYGIVLSWAIRGQGGDGHVNCQDNDEIIPKICRMGYTYDEKETNHLRNSCAEYPNNGWWFKNTLMVFRKV